MRDDDVIVVAAAAAVSFILPNLEDTSFAF